MSGPREDASEGRPRPLKEQHKDHTRTLILRTLADIVAERGLHNFSMRELAEKAGVAQRTVYHHFPTREALLTELAAWLDEELLRRGAPGHPSRAEDLVEGIPFIYRLFDDYKPLVRALAITYTANPSVRPRVREERTRAFQRILREAANGASEEEVRWLSAVTRILANSQSWLFLHDHLGLSGEESGKAVQWALRHLLDAVARRAQDEGPEQAKQQGPQAEQQ